MMGDVMGNIERCWTLLVKPDPNDRVERSRPGDVPLGPADRGFERVVVVPKADLATALDLLREARAFLDTRHGSDGKPRRPANLIEQIDTLTNLGGR